jgi:DNA polymerase/3'-5' exonuclease PolX
MNKQIIYEFEKLVKQINFDLNNSKTNYEKNKHLFRLRQIKNAIKIIQKHKTKILDGNELKDVKGIGKGIIKRIDEIIRNGYLSEISLDIKQDITNNIIDELEKVIGIGQKTANDFVKKGIKSVNDLKKQVKNGIIQVNDEIKVGLKYHKKYNTEIPRGEIDKIDKYLQKIIKRIDKDLKLVICGSYRRKKEISHDIDLLITHKDIKKNKQIVNNDNNYLIKLVEELKEDNFILDDITYKNYITKYMGFCKLKNNPIRRIDIRFFPINSYYTALIHFTGSGELNREMRQKATQLGYKLSEYGLFKILDGGSRYKKIKINSEKDVFDKLNMVYLDPVDR